MKNPARSKAYRNAIRHHIKRIESFLPEKAAMWKLRIRNW